VLPFLFYLHAHFILADLWIYFSILNVLIRLSYRSKITTMAKPDVENAVFLAKLAEQAERYEGKFLISLNPRTHRIANIPI
jgi:hypothetical protein